MKTTGIIRRIDDLGRIVIPKELRKSLRIKNGDSLEIFVDQEDIILKKYSPIESIEEAAIKYVEGCLLYTSPSPRDRQKSRMPSSA